MLERVEGQPPWFAVDLRDCEGGGAGVEAGRARAGHWWVPDEDGWYATDRL